MVRIAICADKLRCTLPEVRDRQEEKMLTESLCCTVIPIQ